MLIIEDGTGIEGANALVTNAELTTYAENRNVDLTSYGFDAIDAAIITASADFISVYYTFKGSLLNDDQGLCIPTDQVGITSKVKQAACNGALLEIQGKLFVSTTDINVNGEVKRTAKSVGSLSTETEYKDGGGYTTKYPTPTIDRLLQPYLIGGFAPATSKRY